MAAVASADDTTTAATLINDVLCKVLFILFVIAPGIGAIVVTLEGIRWIGSSEDPGARKKAKEGIIHVVVGLIIVLLAVPVVTIVMAGSSRFYTCISYISGSSGSQSEASYQVTPYQGNTLVMGPGDNFITNLNLYEGWNLISTPFVLNNSNISNVFSGVRYDIIYSWNASSQRWDYYVPEYGGNLTDIEVDRGYWIHVNKNTTVVLSGRAPHPIRNVSLIGGWNLVGYSGYTSKPLSNALEDVDYVYVYSWNSTQALTHTYGVGWSFNSPYGTGIFYPPPKPPVMKDTGFTDVTPLRVMEQGRGYWIYVDRNVSWIYNTSYPS